MNYQSEEDKKARRKLITIAISTVALILILIVAIVIVSTKKPKEAANTAETTAFDVAKQTEKDTKAEEKTGQTSLGQITTEKT